MTTSRRRALRVGAVLLVAVFLVVFARSVNWPSAIQALRAADPRLVVIALVLNLVSLTLKGVRWWVFLRPLGAVPLPLVLRATFAGASLNNLVVAQGGEGARVLLVARTAAIPSAGVVAALALERALDVLCYLMLLVGAAWSIELPAHLAQWRSGAAVILIACLLAVVALGRASTRAPGVADGIAHSGPRDRVMSYLRRVRGDAALVATPLRLGAGLLLSLAAWALQVATYHLTALALHLPIPLGASVAAQLAVGVSFLVRATPGNVGVFQVIYALTLRPFGIAEGPAVAAAILIQTLQVVPTIAIGTLVAPQLLRGTVRPAG